MKLTKDWQKYDGNYQKEFQDIKLRNGYIIFMCWPNARIWRTCKKEGNEKYYGKDIENEEVEFVRLTHVEI